MACPTCGAKSDGNRLCGKHKYLKAHPEAAERERKRLANECTKCNLPRYRGKSMCKFHLDEQHKAWEEHGGKPAPFFYTARSMNTRARKSEAVGVVTADELQEIAETTSICKYCGIGLHEVEAEFDHIIPISRGGQNATANLQLICKRCNRAKLKSTEVEFMEWIDYIRKTRP